MARTKWYEISKQEKNLMKVFLQELQMRKNEDNQEAKYLIYTTKSYIFAIEKVEWEDGVLPKDRNNKVSCSNYRCEIEIFLEVIGGKWKSLIIWELHQHEVIRYNEFTRILPEITQKMLTQQLRSLEADGIISKEIYKTTPPKVEYFLTDVGLALIPIFERMDRWGKDYIEKYSENFK